MKRIWNFLVHRWNRFRYVIRAMDGAPYLIRYRLLSTPWCGIYLHHILKSDADRHLHDHPWNFISIMLKGEYVEFRSDGTCKPVPTTRMAPAFAKRKAEDFHRLKLYKGVTVWTLVIVGRRRRNWGFMTEDGWVPWQDYCTEEQKKYA